MRLDQLTTEQQFPSNFFLLKRGEHKLVKIKKDSVWNEQEMGNLFIAEKMCFVHTMEYKYLIICLICIM